jgi:hypothetical protein
MTGFGLKQTLWQGLLGAMLTLLLCTPVVWAHGGTNGLLDRMEEMSSRMAASGEMSPEEYQTYQVEIRKIRTLVDQRIQDSGGLNPVKDKDLYDLIDSYNKPLFDAYQQSQAKKQDGPVRTPSQTGPNEDD